MRELVNPQTGERVTVPESALMRQIAQGYRPVEDVAAEERQAALEAEYGGVGGKIAAFSQGTGRGLTLGATDVLAQGITGALTPDAPQLTESARARIQQYNDLHPDKPIPLPDAPKSGYQIGSELAAQGLRDVKEASPFLAGAGEVTGALAGAMASGGSGALAYSPAALVEGAGAAVAKKIAAPIATGIGREALAGAAGGVTEGALSQLALSTADHLPEIIQDPKKGAEQVLQETAGAALVGGLFGGVLRGGAQGLTKGAGKLDEAAQSLAPKVADPTVSMDASNMDQITFEISAKQLPTLEEVAANDTRQPLRKLVEQQDAVDTFQPYVAKTALDTSEDLNQFSRNQKQLQDNVMIKAKKAKNDVLAEGLQSELSDEVEDLGKRGAGADGKPLDIGVVRGRKAPVGAVDELEGGTDLERSIARANAMDLEGRQGARRITEPLERTLSTREVAMRDMFEDTIQRLEGFRAGLGDADAVGIAPMIKQTTQTRDLAMKAMREGRLGDAYHIMDQGLKGSLGHAGMSNNPPLKAVARDLYKGWQTHLEDVNPVRGWGEIGANQAKVNPFLSEEITARKAAALGGMFQADGVKSVNEWDPDMITDPGAIEGLLSGIGTNQAKLKVDAMKRYVETSTRSAIVRAQTWGDDAAVHLALENAKIARRFIDTLESTIKKKADAIAGAASEQSAMGDIVNGMVGTVSPRAAFAMQASGTVKRKVIRAVAEAGSATGSRVAKSAAKLVRNAADATRTAGEVGSQAAAVALGGQLLSERKRDHAIQESQALLDPRSPQTREMLREAADIEDHEPQFAQAYVQSQVNRAQFIASKLPQQTSPAVFGQKPRLDPQKERKLTRYIAASYYPKAMFDRLGEGTASLEDVETAKTLYPSTYSDFVSEVAARLGTMKKPPSRAEQQKIHMLTGLAVRPSMEPENVAALQAQVAASSSGQDLGENGGGPAPKPKLGSVSTNADQYATRSDQIMSGG